MLPLHGQAFRKDRQPWPPPAPRANQAKFNRSKSRPRATINVTAKVSPRPIPRQWNQHRPVAGAPLQPKSRREIGLNVVRSEESHPINHHLRSTTTTKKKTKTKGIIGPAYRHRPCDDAGATSFRRVQQTPWRALVLCLLTQGRAAKFAFWSLFAIQAPSPPKPSLTLETPPPQPLATTKWIYFPWRSAGGAKQGQPACCCLFVLIFDYCLWSVEIDNATSTSVHFTFQFTRRSPVCTAANESPHGKQRGEREREGGPQSRILGGWGWWKRSRVVTRASGNRVDDVARPPPLLCSLLALVETTANSATAALGIRLATEKMRTSSPTIHFLPSSSISSPVTTSLVW